MTAIQFLAEWALRSSILILSGALLLQALRVKDSSIRLAAWSVLLCGSLAIPLLAARAPKLAMPQVASAMRVYSFAAEAAPLRYETLAVPAASPGFDWARAGMWVYVLAAGTLLLRLGAGLAVGRRMLRRSNATGRAVDGIEIRESARVAAPVTLGIARCAIVLPPDWREWDSAKLDAVLAHEVSHIRRHDPAVQVLSAIHRALLWHSPLSWFLHRRIVRVAEEASDDAAVAATRDRASYAEVLLDFMQRGVRGAHWQGVAMARYGSPDARIHRILDGAVLSRGVTRGSLAAILVLASPLAYIVAAVHPQSVPAATAAPQAPAAPAPAAPQQSETIRRYMIVTGDSTSGSWDSRDPVDRESLRGKYGRNFAWFRLDGSEYVVTDAGVMAELERAMEPQRRVNTMQGEVNKSQSKVNDMQAEVNRKQAEVNVRQQLVNQRQELMNKIQQAAQKGNNEALARQLEGAARDLRASTGESNQDSVNRAQSEVNKIQSNVNAEQSKVNEQQHKVNEEQQRISGEFSRRVQEILNSALQRHLAQRLM